MLLYTYATQRPIGTRARSLHVGTPAHVYTVPVATLITAARARSYTTALPYSPIRLAPAGQKTAWGASRQKSDSHIGRAEEAPAALKDTPRRVQKPPLRKKTQDVATG